MYVVKTKALFSRCSSTTDLYILFLVYAKRFSHDSAHMMLPILTI